MIVHTLPGLRQVEVQVHGPYHKTCSRNEFVLTMTCPESGWCCARAVPASGLPTNLADFLFHSFCNYGFARCFLVSCSPDLREAVSAEYSVRVSVSTSSSYVLFVVQSVLLNIHVMDASYKLYSSTKQ